MNTVGNCPCQLDGCGLYREGGGIIARSPRVSFRRWKEMEGFGRKCLDSALGIIFRSRIQNNKKIGTTMQMLPGEGELCCIQDLQIYKCFTIYI